MLVKTKKLYEHNLVLVDITTIILCYTFIHFYHVLIFKIKKTTILLDIL